MYLARTKIENLFAAPEIHKKPNGRSKFRTIKIKNPSCDEHGTDDKAIIISLKQ